MSRARNHAHPNCVTDEHENEECHAFSQALQPTGHRRGGRGSCCALVAGCGSSGGGTSSGVFPSAGSSTSNKGGGGSGDLSPHALLAASVDKTLAAKNGKLHLEFKGAFGGQDITFGGDGIADFAGKKFQLQLNLPAASGISGTIEERVIGKDFYLKFPDALATQLGGKSWIKLSAADLGASSSTGLDQLGQDPTQFLSTLRSVSNSITKVGTEEIRGVRTTHYRAEVDLSKAAAATGASGLSSTTIEQYKKLLGSTTLPEDVYLDDNGLARRFSVSLSPSVPVSAGTTSTGAFTVTVDLYDFGSTDTSGIVAPPASEVGSLPTGLSSGLGG